MTTKKQDRSDEVRKINSVHVVALWKGFTPDCRAYKPSTPELVFDPALKIGVDVPLDKELIDNAMVISAAQLSAQNEPSPVFTPLGMRYVIDQFEAVMKNGEPEVKTATTDDEWEDEPVKEKKSSDDEWEDEAADTPVEEEKDFDEDWN